MIAALVNVDPTTPSADFGSDQWDAAIVRGSDIYRPSRASRALGAALFTPGEALEAMVLHGAIAPETAQVLHQHKRERVLQLLESNSAFAEDGATGAEAVIAKILALLDDQRTQGALSILLVHKAETFTVLRNSDGQLMVRDSHRREQWDFESRDQLEAWFNGAWCRGPRGYFVMGADMTMFGLQANMLSIDSQVDMWSIAASDLPADASLLLAAPELEPGVRQTLHEAVAALGQRIDAVWLAHLSGNDAALTAETFELQGDEGAWLWSKIRVLALGASGRDADKVTRTQFEQGLLRRALCSAGVQPPAPVESADSVAEWLSEVASGADDTAVIVPSLVHHLGRWVDAIALEFPPAFGSHAPRANTAEATGAALDSADYDRDGPVPRMVSELAHAELPAP